MQIDPEHLAFDPRYVLHGRLREFAFDVDERPFGGAGFPLIVPLDVQALVVPEGQAVDHADVAVHLLDADGFDAEIDRTSEPFTEGEPRDSGVHLHWAMPDSLTRGTAADDGTLSQSALPDRWLVLRLEQGPRRTWEAWVIESEYGRSHQLMMWAGEPPPLTGEPPPGYIPRDQLSATAGGDPAWAAVYDNIVDRFGFHDSLEDVDAGSVLSYVVVGWYGDLGLDPLAAVRDQNTFDDVLASLRWTVSEEAHRHLDRLSFVAEGTHTATQRRQNQSNRASEYPNIAWATETARERYASANAGLAHAVSESPWPRRSVLHGAVYGVRADGGGLDQRPPTGDLSAAAGATATEALATLIGERQNGGGDAEERATAAFAYGLTDRLGEHDGPAQVDEALHTRAFESQPGGYIVEWIRQGDRLAELRPDGPAATVHPATGDVGDGANEAIEGTTTGIAWEAASRSTFAESAILPEMTDLFGGEQLGAGSKATWKAAFEFSADIGELGFARRSPREILAGMIREIDQVVPVRRAEPRWYQPQDPVVAIQGSKRNLRHGHDGRFVPDESVACRLGWDVQDTWDFLAGQDLLATPLLHDSLPPEAARIVHEAALEDPSNMPGTIERALEGRPLDSDISAYVSAEIVMGRYARDPELETSVFAAVSRRIGTMSSAIAVTEWTGQPWIPLYLEWELDVDLSDRLGGWKLGELDLDPPEDVAADPRRTLSGRSLVTSASVKALAQEVRRVLEEEDIRDVSDAGQITEAGEMALRRVARSAGTMDVLSAALEGLRENLLGYETNLVLQPRAEGAPLATPEDADPPPDPLPTAPALLARAGFATLRRARLVDAFGRSVEVPCDHLLVSQQLALPDGVRLSSDPVPDDAAPAVDAEPAPPRLLLRPRLNLPTRMMLRLLDAERDDIEATIDQRTTPAAMPIAGWLVPDHIDHALEVFDSDGLPLGQLRHDHAVAPELGGAVVWEGTPGRPGPTGVSPGELVANRHVRSLVTELVERDLTRREAVAIERRDNPNFHRESPLAALLRTLDTTQWTVDPVSTLGWEFPGALVGRPLAVVRARLTLEVLGDLDDERWEGAPDAAAARRTALDRLQGREFEVRLGSLTRMHDGLFAYYVNDDYSQAHPVHPSVLANALSSGPGAGYQQDAESAAAFDPTSEDSVDRVTDLYISPDPTITIRPGQTRMLTLLMDPGLSAHVTTGYLPRKEITLLRDWIEEPMRVIAPSFRIGPVLVDPTTIRMPRPAGMPGQQMWTRRAGPTSWRDDPIEAATQDARVPDGAHVTQEGWIRLVYEEEGTDG